MAAMCRANLAAVATRASPDLCGRGAHWLGIILLALLSGCATSRPGPNVGAATPALPDISCPHCTMKEYVWNSYLWRSGRWVHHDIWNMECPVCVVRMSGIWLLIGPSHSCTKCRSGVSRCPMCRAADRDDGHKPTSQPTNATVYPPSLPSEKNRLCPPSSQPQPPEP